MSSPSAATRVATTICVVTAISPDAAAVLADAITDLLTVHPGEQLRLRTTGSTVVIVLTSHAAPVNFADSLSSILMDVDFAGLFGPGPGWGYWTDGTGALARILGDNPDAWDAFATLLPGATDTLENLASVAVRISTPARGVTVASPQTTTPDPRRQR